MGLRFSALNQRSDTPQSLASSFHIIMGQNDILLYHFSGWFSTAMEHVLFLIGCFINRHLGLSSADDVSRQAVICLLFPISIPPSGGISDVITGVTSLDAAKFISALFRFL